MSSKSPRTKIRVHRHSPGMAPGTMTVDPNAPKTRSEVIGYGPAESVRREIRTAADLESLRNRWPVLWIDVEGLGDAEMLRDIARVFHLHPLAMEDVVNTNQRAKVEQYAHTTFIVFNMIEFDRRLETEQISLFLGPDFVITFQERLGGDCLDPIRNRIAKGQTRLRNEGADFLAYSILDAVIDHYFPVLESFGERLEELEDDIVTRPRQEVITVVHALKRELLCLRRLIWPLREAVNSMLRDNNPLIGDETKLFLRDCYDHAVRVIDLIETDREICSDLMDLYLSSASNRMGEVMRVLTVISTIFIPLTFIVGLYGMNFQRGPDRPWNMPELDWYWGYPACLAAMAIIALGLLVVFWRRGWLGAQGAALSREEEGLAEK